MKALFYYLIFPGFLFSAVAGLLSSWVERKVTARIQWRVGPPWYQNFLDLIKLSGKETIIPKQARATFLLAPYLGLFSLVLAATILGLALFTPQQSFTGDLIVVVYLLVIPAICAIIGASSSRNPLASVGAAREMKLVLGYELPFVLSIATVIVKTHGGIRLGDILAFQMNFNSLFFSFSGALAFIAALLCCQAKLGLAPFEVAEAEQEIMAGTVIEYSGSALAAFKLTKAILLYTMPVLLILFFLGKDISPIFSLAKYIIILVVFILIKNTNPRLRIDQAVRFFWGPVTAIAGLALILALLGL
ncbi:MAG: NADH-quinone oxidoreductase subunit H [Candidatus Omnitrophica bacterium]|nr:NADH-quinone oxidoreductase subunit H [Candidatus Omnitrophota bacterium]MDD5653149.1 NADH-quinone oxidoreductase subunit H [Candidatus Omnitrophota bacterium]